MSTMTHAEGDGTNISKAQAQLLAAAAGHPQGLLPTGTGGRAGLAHGRTVQALLRRGLVRRVTYESIGAASPTEGGGLTWHITAAGLLAIGRPDVLLGTGRGTGETEDASAEAEVTADSPATQQKSTAPARKRRPAAQNASGDAEPATGAQQGVTPTSGQNEAEPQLEAVPRPVKSKADLLIGLLKREEGASIDELTAASGWQAHSVRGFISGTLKKRLGMTVTSAKDTTGTGRYRIAG